MRAYIGAIPVLGLEGKGLGNPVAQGQEATMAGDRLLLGIRTGRYRW